MEGSTGTEHARLEKTTMTIARDQIAYLDEISASIRRHSGTVVCRSALIRGFVRAFQSGGLVFSKCTSEDDLARSLARFFSTCRASESQRGSARK